MTSNQPYLLRAIHQWIIDNDFTPYLIVDANVANVEVPAQSVKDGQIVLNLAPQAVTNMLMDDVAVSFSARFSGVAQSIYIPIQAIRAIYANENGQGMVFAEEPKIAEPKIEEPKVDLPATKSPSFLKVIK